jgi:hypothetical protein
MNYTKSVSKLYFEYDEITCTLKIKFQCNFNISNKIPVNTKHIIFTENRNWLKSEFNNGSLSSIPKYLIDSLESIEFGSSFNLPVDYSNSKIKKINFGYHFDQVKVKLPPTLKYLSFCGIFNKPIDFIADLINLEQLIFGDTFNQSIDKVPKSLKNFSLGLNFTHSLDKLPENLEILYLNLLNLKKQISNLPITLKIIYIHPLQEQYLKVPWNCVIKYIGRDITFPFQI